MGMTSRLLLQREHAVTIQDFSSPTATRPFTYELPKAVRSQQELHAFQEELARQENTREWSFIAYYEPLTP